MPISKENEPLYPGGSINSPEWKALRRRILERAGHKCEWCKAPNRERVIRSNDGVSYMRFDGEVRHATNGRQMGYARGSEYPGGKWTKIVLTIAHLDHDPSNSNEFNLRALCQKCHNGYDRVHRQANAKKTRRSRKAAGDLFEPGEVPSPRPNQMRTVL